MLKRARLFFGKIVLRARQGADTFEGFMEGNRYDTPNIITKFHKKLNSFHSFLWNSKEMQTPPNSVLSEQNTIGGLLLDNTKMQEVKTIIAESDFYEYQHRLIFAAMRELDEAGSPFDIVTLSEHLERSGKLQDAGGLAYIGLLAKETASSANTAVYAAIVREESAKRHALKKAQDIINSIHSGDIPEAAEITEALTSLKTAGRGSSKPSIGKSARDLMKMDFPPIKWIVEGLLYDGSRSILSAKPKIGKSWLALDIAIAASAGGRAMGRYKCTKTTVLYLALEDLPRHLKERIEMVLIQHGMNEPPEGFFYDCEILKADGGGIEQIEQFIQETGCGLVIVDTLKKVRADSKGNKNIYDIDYESTQAFKALSERYGTAFLFVHHLRKATSEDGDIMDMVSGSFGLTAGLDNVLVLTRQRGSSSAELHIAGRGLEESTISLTFEQCIWKVLAEDVSGLTPERLQVIEAIREGMNTPLEIAGVLGKSVNSISVMLFEMLKARQISKASKGVYSLAVSESHNLPDDDGVVYAYKKRVEH